MGLKFWTTDFQYHTQYHVLIAVPALSKARNVYDCCNNRSWVPTLGMYVRLYSVFVLACVCSEVLQWADLPFRGSYQISVRLINSELF
jgi:hypothetical protein